MGKRMPYTLQRGIYRVGKALTKPGAFIHEKAANAIYSEAVQTLLYAVAAALLFVGTLSEIVSPGSTIHPVIVILVALLLFAALILLIGFTVPAVLYMICAVTAPFAYINERCTQKLSGGETGGGQTRRPGPGGGPRKRPGLKFEQAEELFGVKEPYTRDEVRDARNRLLKKYHPDMGGSEELAKKINAAYELLIKHAS